jgi:hypothetical protein
MVHATGARLLNLGAQHRLRAFRCRRAYRHHARVCAPWRGARHVYVCTACVHGMCTACARHVCTACAATAWVCSIPPLTHNSCWDDGNPHRRIEAGCPPFSPPTPSPPSSPPHSDRQRRLGSNTSNGHYSRGKVHTACACMCACACACVACGMCMHVQHVCICALRVHVQCAVVCAYTCTYTQTHLIVSEI